MNKPAPFKIVFKNLTIVFLLLLAIPIVAWGFHWQWHADQNYTFIDFILYLVTQTGTAPFYALITTIVLAIWLSMRCKLLQHHWVLIFLSVLLLQGATQIIKSGIKYAWEEPRPYMSYIAEKEPNLENFYEYSRKERSNIITVAVAEESITPSWLKHHWQKETGYSFPSGHTIFAAIWAFIIAGFLTREQDPKRKLYISIITIWAGLMMISRLRLGMHFPIDLFVSTIIAYLVASIFFLFLAKREAQIDQHMKKSAKIRQQ